MSGVELGIPCAWTGDGDFWRGGGCFCGGIGVGEASHGVSEGFVVAVRARHGGGWANGCGDELFVLQARMGSGGDLSD